MLTPVSNYKCLMRSVLALQHCREGREEDACEKRVDFYTDCN